MTVYKVECVEGDSPSQLKENINKFLKEIDCELIDIKYQVVTRHEEYIYDLNFSALIICVDIIREEVKNELD